MKKIKNLVITMVELNKMHEIMHKYNGDAIEEISFNEDLICFSVFKNVEVLDVLNRTGYLSRKILGVCLGINGDYIITFDGIGVQNEM